MYHLFSKWCPLYRGVLLKKRSLTVLWRVISGCSWSLLYIVLVQVDNNQFYLLQFTLNVKDNLQPTKMINLEK